MKVVPEMTIVIDISRPSEELPAVIMAIANSQPGRQLELLQELDLWLGETIANIEKQIETTKANTEE